MATNTTIEWADKTWSPIIGCDRVSEGCRGCYAISTARIRSFNPNPKISTAFAGTVDRINGRLDWTGQINQLDDRLTQPLTWRKPVKVFVNSQSDLFHKNVDTEFIAKVFAVMAATPQHTYQILSKRHARMRSLLSSPTFADMVDREFLDLTVNKHPRLAQTQWQYPLPNVHLGVSVEDQHWADIRIPALLGTPAAVRWISAEPLLGPVDLTRLAANSSQQPNMVYDALGQRYGVPGAWQAATAARLDWVVAGGESGPTARPPHPDWFRSLRDQCAASGVPYLFKQWGDWADRTALTGDQRANASVWDEKRVTYVHPVDGRPQSHGQWGMHDHLEGWAAMQRVGKKAAGRELDGRTWDEFPEAA